MIGAVLAGKYQIVRELGSGNMGEVYEAKNVATGRKVAIKVIRSELAKNDALVLRFQREARAAGAIESRHIAQVLDAGKDVESGCPYLVMEFLSGEDLDAVVKRLGPLRPRLALTLVAQALAGLERAHSANVIHRDIKPANLFLAGADAGQLVVKVVDFGIAKVKGDLAASSDVALTQTSSLLGSPLYMSPEQAKASKTVDARADVWSMGVVLYQLLAGAAPHARAESLTELLLSICTTETPSVQDTSPWVPEEVSAIVARALRIDVRHRWGSAAEMLHAIATLVPDWNNLSAAMLTPMSAEERSFVAPRAVVPSMGAIGISSSGAASSSQGHLPIDRTLPLMSRDRSGVGAQSSGAGAVNSGISNAGLASSNVVERSKERKGRSILLVGGAGIAGVLVWGLFGGKFLPRSTGAPAISIEPMTVESVHNEGASVSTATPPPLASVSAAPPAVSADAAPLVSKSHANGATQKAGGPVASASSSAPAGSAPKPPSIPPTSKPTAVPTSNASSAARTFE